MSDCVQNCSEGVGKVSDCVGKVLDDVGKESDDIVETWALLSRVFILLTSSHHRGELLPLRQLLTMKTVSFCLPPNGGDRQDQ